MLFSLNVNCEWIVISVMGSKSIMVADALGPTLDRDIDSLTADLDRWLIQKV